MSYPRQNPGCPTVGPLRIFIDAKPMIALSSMYQSYIVEHVPFVPDNSVYCIEYST